LDLAVRLRDDPPVDVLLPNDERRDGAAGARSALSTWVSLSR